MPYLKVSSQCLKKLFDLRSEWFISSVSPSTVTYTTPFPKKSCAIPRYIQIVGLDSVYNLSGLKACLSNKQYNDFCWKLALSLLGHIWTIFLLVFSIEHDWGRKMGLELVDLW